MAFHFPLMPRIFMALRLEDVEPIVEIMRRTPADPRHLPVGALPAQPRRADARDGDDRRARLHVPRLLAGPADEAQRRHPPAPRAARRQLAAAHGAPELAPLLVPRHADRLLRRRDRHGRQHLPARPQRRPDAHAVDARTGTPASPARDPAPALHGAHLRPGLRLPGGERRGAVARSVLAPPLDAQHHRAPEALQGVRPRHDRVPPGRRTARCSPTCAATRRTCSSASRTCRASRSPPSSTSPSSRGTCRWRSSATPSSRASGSCPYFLTLGPYGFYWFELRKPD